MEFLNNEDPLISQLENRPRLHLRVINTKSIQPLSGGPFKNRLKTQVLWATHTAHKWLPAGDGRNAPLPPPNSAGQALGRAPITMDLAVWLPAPTTTTTSEGPGSNHQPPVYPPRDFPSSPEGTSSKSFPLSTHAFKVSSECNFKLEFAGVLSHSNKDLSVLRNISFPYICWRENSRLKDAQFFPIYYPWPHQVSPVTKMETHNRHNATNTGSLQNSKWFLISLRSKDSDLSSLYQTAPNHATSLRQKMLRGIRQVPGALGVY